MIISRFFSGAALAALTVAAAGSAYAFDVPVNDGFVTDFATAEMPNGLLSDEEEDALEADLTQYRTETSNEIAVVTVPNLNGEAVADVAVEIGRKWGVGTDEDNGILMLISYEDREIWIATGYGLEGAVPDLIAHGIAAKDIAPAFKEAEYAEGIQAGIAALKKHIGGEYTAERYEESADVSGFFPWVIFLIFIGLDWLAAIFGRSKSWWLGGVVGGVLGLVLTVIFSWWVSIPVLVLLGLFFDYIVSKAGPRSRGGRGGPWGGMGGTRGGGSGGFGGFGGGSFGGGGGGSKW